MVLFLTFGLSVVSFFSSLFPFPQIPQPKPLVQRHAVYIPLTSSPQELRVSQTPSPREEYLSSPISQQLLSDINAYRSSLHLSSVTMNPSTCAFAQIRAQEIATSFSHDGFTSRVQKGMLPYASYSLVTENIAEAPSSSEVVSLWVHSPEHAKNMRQDTPFVCVGAYGNYYAYEGLKP